MPNPRNTDPINTDPGNTDKYDHGALEEKWQGRWEARGAFSCASADVEGKPKYYVLEMFPYPSGKIHMGHVRNYSIGDVVARFHMMNGKSVLHPMGWDSFGLPAENAAIQNKTHPAKWTYDNIDNMRTQLRRLGFSYDWSREIATSTPEYYRWNQWFFLKFLEKGLAYKKSSTVNWCPSCSTVLANEQVEDNLCWRCESVVEAKELEQWFLKTTEYAEELLKGTETLSGWPERVLTMQRNWIGKSVGARVRFNVKGFEGSIEIFTTRPDTLFGVTFMSLAPEHPLVASLTTPEHKARVEAFVKKVKAVDLSRTDEADFEKEGVFTGAYCTNPLTGDEVPVYVANFVLMAYGTGAVMAVPAHDQRDFEFATQYKLPVKVVINPLGSELKATEMEEAYVEDGIMVDSGEFTGLPNRDAMGKILEHIEAKGYGAKAVTYRLRDWGISRQRYWGCPIPIVYCDSCGTVPVPYEELPLLLPEDVSLTGKGLSPLDTGSFTETECPKCKGPATRETDTMDTFVDSSWYFLRYLTPDASELPFDKSDASYWLPVDQYIGGIEHAVMHLLYARFFTKAVRDLGLIDLKDGEPFKNLLTQGMVCMETLKCEKDGFLYPEESRDGKCTRCGGEATVGAIEKMSKSKKNTIDPDGIIARYGADTTRLFSLFAAPPERDLDWNVEGVEGSYRFISRVWRLVTEHIELLKGADKYNGEDVGDVLRSTRRETHKTIEKVTKDIGERFHFNTAISSIMELTNHLYQADWKGAGTGTEGKLSASVLKEAVEAIVVLLAPVAPHVTEELWERLGNSTPLYETPWPKHDPDAMTVDSLELVVQINGKMRAKVTVPATASKEEVESLVRADPDVIKWCGDKSIVKFIYVPGKIANLVVK